jgi:EAL domain-containing protein (putative c-di-GMP-specific phosphodiesterase class I)/DNA-binding response OmpR family regulator
MKRTIKFLVLDDDLFTLKMLAKMLNNLGYLSVTTCHNGGDALIVVDNPNDAPDLILLDLNMPEMDGVEFVRHLAEHRYAGKLILVSGEDEQMLLATEKLVHEYQIPVLGHLNKPVRPEGLAALIEPAKSSNLSALIEKLNSSSQEDAEVENVVYTEEDLRAAIASGELVNYYQPVVAPSTGRVVGVEALVRWNHPRDGMVIPSRFIGVAEIHGLINDLTGVVLSGALTQLKRWDEAGLSLQLSVNVSLVSMATLDFVDFMDFIGGLAKDVGVATSRVTLEVPESLMQMDDLRVPLEILTRLRLKGFRLSIDAFGSGYFSQSQLRDLPFNEIKIDRRFVHQVSTNNKVRETYDDCLSMAKKLDMQVVAVGVEKIGDWNMLYSTGCDLAQGYYIAKPMPASDLPGWIQSQVFSGLI